MITIISRAQQKNNLSIMNLNPPVALRLASKLLSITDVRIAMLVSKKPSIVPDTLAMIPDI